MKLLAILLLLATGTVAARAGAEGGAKPAGTAPLDLKNHPEMTWIKRTPVNGAPPNPRMGYESSYGWDAANGVIIRWGGHNQGGGGEQNAETWHYDPIANTWNLIEPNTSPPGNCCCRENVFDPAHGRFIRFPAFFHSHGWQWRRTGYTRDSSVWSYDAAAQTWRNMRPMPEAWPRPMRGAAWDPDAQVILIASGEGHREGTIVYDPHVNRWTWMKPKPEFPTRNTFGLAYDTKRKCYYAFGDQYGRDQRTWKYDLKANTWTDLKPAHRPAKFGDGTVMAYDPVSDVVIANLRQGTEKVVRRETWAYLPSENNWKKLQTSGTVTASGPRNTIMLYLPEHNVFLLENRTRTQQQVWTFRYAAAKADPRPAAPTGLTVSTAADSAQLTWKPVKGAKSCNVYRGTGKQPWLVTYAKIGATMDPAMADGGLKTGTVYHYYVTAVGAAGRESAPSLKIRTQTWVVQDVLVSVAGPKKVELSWPAPGGDDVAGYLVERADVMVYSMDELKHMKTYTDSKTKKVTAIYVPRDKPAVADIRRIGRFKLLTTKLLTQPAFVDVSVDLEAGQVKSIDKPLQDHDLEKYRDPKGKPCPWRVYAYRVRAVNRLGVESGDSPWFLTIPEAPQHVFSRERGQTVDLKWAPHKDKRIVGYNVYRMWHRWSGTPFDRLNDQPVKGTTFTDTKAGKRTHRYFVVAVDALGQEGLIGSPVWSNREWRRMYKPFVGEWHQ